MYASRDTAAKYGNSSHPSSRPPATIDFHEPFHDSVAADRPTASIIPFIDGKGICTQYRGGLLRLLTDDPPFYLHKASSDEGSIQAMQAEQLSSRPGYASQVAPLSHSLLSQLELSENDPNTFRDIIDDLTVQNQKLKRRIKRYKKITTKKSENAGIFEVRAQNLPSAKKQELQHILQNFASTLRSSLDDPAFPSVASYQRSRPRDTDVRDKSTAIRSVARKNEDSTYASGSPAGGTLHAVSGKTDLSSNDLQRQQQPRQRVGIRAVHPDSARLPSPSKDLCDVSDEPKKLIVVQRLEQLFLTGTARMKLSEHEVMVQDSRCSSGSSESASPDGTEQPRSRPHKLVLERAEGRGSRTEASYLQTPNDGVSKSTSDLPMEHSYEASKPTTSQNSSSPAGTRYLREIGLASPVAETSTELTYEWMYLNILVNMAQLHTLNITADFIRQAIRDVSTRLVLSEDGRKVRWGEGQTNGIDTSSVPHDLDLEVGPSPNSSSSAGYSVRLQQSPNGSQLEHTANLRFEPCFEPQSKSVHPAVQLRRIKNGNSSYKPLFLRNKRRGTKSGLRKHSSTVKSGLSSDDEVSSVLSHASNDGPNLQGQPMIFFEDDPFFIDLSADPPDVNGHNPVSYTAFIRKPLGVRQTASDQLHDYERRSTLLEQASHDSGSLRDRNQRDSPEAPSLKIHSDNADISTYRDSSDENKELVPFEASGLGGIQLDDHFSMNVLTEYEPPVTSVTNVSQSRKFHSGLNTILPSIPAIGGIIRSHHIIACTTVHLLPSPLPPPSYVYPALSSSSSLSSTSSDTEDDMTSESEVSTPRFRPMSLSPQMRMFLERQGESEAGVMVVDSRSEDV
ncbi:MAG: hypothetical protein Q9222_002624 [Ikaeria aurantiellina]